MHVWILATTARSGPGGMRRHMELHAEGLVRLGHQASLFFEEDLARWPGGLAQRLPGARSLATLFARCRAEAPEVVNVHTYSASAWILAHRAGVISSKIVVMSYAADEPNVVIRSPRDAVTWARAALPARTTFRHASGIWCVNQQDVEFYVSTYGVERRRIGRFPHAVADAFWPRATDDAEPRNLRRVLFVGTWLHRKGVDVLARALATVVQQIPDVEVVLAGTQQQPGVVERELDPELRARTTVINFADDEALRKLYRTSALLLVPSRREGLPITMLEAMVCGCPPLAAANSGMLDAIEPGRNGWLEVSFDPASWAERIVSLLGDPDGLRRASDGALRHSERYRLEPVTSDVLHWYETLR